MILWFSGTGNSLWVAQELSRHLGDELVAVTHLARQPLPRRAIWVFPIHSWGVPPIVRKAIAECHWPGVPAFMVATCGDDAGHAARQWRRDVSAAGMTPRTAYTVEMPNTYVCLPGFDVDAPEIEQRKLSAAPTAVARIAADIEAGGTADAVTCGAMPRVKTSIIYPWFMRHLTTPKRFCHTEGCTSCGRCAQLCPTQNIAITAQGPVWDNRCTHCLACYHCCPHRAIRYGHYSAHKHQYLNPIYRKK